MDRDREAHGGCGFFGTLLLIFVVLKVAGLVTWSWWWVLAPLWGPPLFVLALCAGAYVIGRLKGFPNA